MNHTPRGARRLPPARPGRILFFIALAAITLLLSACGPSVTSYLVNMRYLYTGQADEADVQPRVTITVARFRDSRVTVDKSAVGAVRAPWWNESVPVLPKSKTPAEIVTDGAKAQLVKSGFTLLSAPPPVWDLEAATLDKAWGRYVLGGVIEELYLNGKKDPPFCSYEASVRLTFVMGDTQTHQIRRFSMEREGFLSLVTMNEDSLERLINSVLSQVIAEGLNEDRVRRALRDVSQAQPVR